MDRSNLQKAVRISDAMIHIDRAIEILSDSDSFRFDDIKIRNDIGGIWLGDILKNKIQEYMRHICLIEAEKERARLLNAYRELDGLQEQENEF